MAFRIDFQKIAIKWKIISQDSLALLLIGSFLTYGIGSCLNSKVQEKSWERQKKFEILKHDIDSSFQLIEDLSILINKRFFNLQRVCWALKKQNQDEILKTWDDYYETVIEQHFGQFL